MLFPQSDLFSAMRAVNFLACSIFWEFNPPATVLTVASRKTGGRLLVWIVHVLIRVNGIQSPLASLVHLKLPLAGSLPLAPAPNPNGIESFSPRLSRRRGTTLGSRPVIFSTRNGLHHLLPKRIQPRWGKIHFTITTRRSRCASTPG